MKKVIIVNHEAWETRIAVLQNDILHDLYFDRKNAPGLEKSFVKGRVVNILPGIQTAFVEIGEKKAGFLHISEIDRNLAVKNLLKGVDFETEDIFDPSLKKKKKERKSITSLLKPGEEVLVQIKKEPVAEKGAKLTTCYTMPGKFLVLMPNIDQIGVSSKIESKVERTRLKDLMKKLLPQNMGVVVRTDAEGKLEEDLERDLKLLCSAWQNILKKYKDVSVGDTLYTDLPLSVRMIREHVCDGDNVEIYCDHPKDLEEMGSFLKGVTHNNKIKLFLEVRENLFEKFKINKQIEGLLEKKVNLKSGGNIVIEHTEAMTVVDVNSSKFVGKTNQEETSLKINLEAAKEVVRQLRLRNIGGIIIIDFIDMQMTANKKSLMTFLEEELKASDKLRSMTLKISELGLIQMTRTRTGLSLEQKLMHNCPSCAGLGVVKTDETLAAEILRFIKNQLILENSGARKVEVSVSEKIFEILTKKEFKSILYLENVYGVKVCLVKNKLFKELKHKIVFLAK